MTCPGSLSSKPVEKKYLFKELEGYTTYVQMHAR